MERNVTIVVLLMLITFTSAKAQTNRTEGRGGKRTGKLFSFISVIRFPNDGCSGSNNVSGTCFTADECSDKKGTNGGACAQGYGVCCIFSLGCGSRSAQNCTYFTSGTVTAGMCTLTVCKAGASICQLRLDFNSFMLSPPSTTVTPTIGPLLNGQLTPSLAPLPPGAVAANTVTECLTDSFSVTNPDGSAPPTICGSNAMQHMYVDASEACNNLVFQIGTSSTTTRQWSIKITQYACDYSNLAPSGCVQYFFDPSGTGTVTSFNFDGGEHLANQHQSVCVRLGQLCSNKENYSTLLCIVSGGRIPSAGSVGQQLATWILLYQPTVCCQYATIAANIPKGYDCVSIPGASKPGKTRIASRICGNGAGLVTANSATTGNIVCSTRVPFLLNFFSDNYEYVTEGLQKGFRLVYKQTTC